MPLPAPVTREILLLSAISHLSFILSERRGNQHGRRRLGSSISSIERFFWTPPPETVTLPPRAHERGPMNILHDELKRDLIDRGFIHRLAQIALQHHPRISQRHVARRD